MNNGNQSRLYAPFPHRGVREGNSNRRIVHHCLVRIAMKFVVAQFCRAKPHEIINEGTECVQLENVMQFSHYHQLADEPAAAQPIAQSVYHWPVGS